MEEEENENSVCLFGHCVASLPFEGCPNRDIFVGCMLQDVEAVFGIIEHE